MQLCPSAGGCSQVGYILAGPSPEQVDDAKCRSYGAVKGDPAYVQCRAQLAASRNVAGAVEAPRSTVLIPIQ